MAYHYIEHPYKGAKDKVERLAARSWLLANYIRTDLSPIVWTPSMRCVTANSSKVGQMLKSGFGQNCKTKGSQEVHFDGTVLLHHIHFTNDFFFTQLSSTSVGWNLWDCVVLTTPIQCNMSIGKIPKGSLLPHEFWRFSFLNPPPLGSGGFPKKIKFPSRDILWEMHACVRSGRPLRSPRKKRTGPFSPFVEIWQLWKSVEVDWPGLEIKLASSPLSRSITNAPPCSIGQLHFDSYR